MFKGFGGNCVYLALHIWTIQIYKPLNWITSWQHHIWYYSCLWQTISISASSELVANLTRTVSMKSAWHNSDTISALQHVEYNHRKDKPWGGITKAWDSSPNLSLNAVTASIMPDPTPKHHHGSSRMKAWAKNLDEVCTRHLICKYCINWI